MGTLAASNLSGTNTGDQTTVSGNAGTATALATPRTIGGVSFDGTANITVSSATGNFAITGTLDANGQVDLGDGGDAIVIDGTALTLQTTGAGSDITLNAVDQIILTDFANCTALETSSGVLTCGSDDGGGVPTTITVADTTDTTSFVGIFESATGDLGPKTDAGLTYNASTGVLTATGFSGPLTGNVSGI